MEKYYWNAAMAGLVIFWWNNAYQINKRKTISPQRAQRTQRTQSFTFLTAPSAQLKIQSFSLCPLW